MRAANQPLQTGNLFLLLLNQRLLLFDLRLLFLDGVDEDGGELIVFDAFNLVVLVFESEQRLDLCHLFRDQADGRLLTSLPVEADRLETIDDLQTRAKRFYVSLVAQAGATETEYKEIGVISAADASGRATRNYLELAQSK